MRSLCSQDTSSSAAAIDPRIRILAAALLLILVVSSRSPFFPGMVALICLAAAMASGLRPRLLLVRLMHPLFIALAVLALKMFCGPAPLQTLHPAGISLPFSPAGLREGLLISARILSAVSVAILLGHLLSFTEAMAAMAWLRAPRGLIEVSLFAWRTLFMLYEDASIVYAAQKSRLGYSGLRRGLRSFGSMAGLLTIRAFDSSHTMTTAMSQRGFDGSLPLLTGSRPATIQIIGLLVFALLSGAAWAIQN